jgi:hypothetical protein
MKQSKFSEQKIACVTNVYCVSVAQSYDRRLPAFGKNTRGGGLCKYSGRLA